MKKIVLLTVVLAAALGIFMHLRQPPVPASAPEEAAPAPELSSSPQAPPPVSRSVTVRAPQIPSAAAPVSAPPSVEASQELVGKITAVALGHASLNRSDAEGMRQHLLELKGQGVLAIPGIREFLSKNQDISFTTPPEVESIIGFPSLRLALLDVFQATGGPEVVTAAMDTLKSTGDPVEIATLAAILEKNAPGEHRLEAVKAAADSLALGSSGQLPGQRMAPAFEVLQTYGDSSVVPLLRDQVKGAWGQNAAVALAELPEGAGIPALIALAQDPSVLDKGDAALRPLAQAAVRYPQAFDALLDLAKQGNIPDQLWPGIASALSASDYVSNGNLIPETRSPAVDLHSMLAERLVLLDRLSTSGGLSEAALRVVQQRRGELDARLRSR